MDNCFLCKTSLKGKHYVKVNNRFCCIPCFEINYANDCHTCGKKISPGQVDLVYHNRHWHQNCFTCSECKIAIKTTEFRMKSNDVYCLQCFAEKFALKCFKCKKAIEGGYVMYQNQPVHSGCFTCNECGLALAAKRYAIQKNQPYCVDCFGKSFGNQCKKCNLPITGGRYIHEGKNFWHKHCFNCSKCNKRLVDENFYREENLVCVECYEAM